MTSKWKRRLMGAAKALVLAVLLVSLAVVLLVQTGVVESWARGAIVTQIERMTGGRVVLEEFRFSLLGLRAELVNLTIHGREPEGTPPFFHADYVMVDVRVDSLVGRKVSLDEIRIDNPMVHVRIDAEGTSNVPKPAPRAQPASQPAPDPTQTAAPGKPWRERIFDIQVRKVRLNGGEVLFNNTRVPLVVEGDEMEFALDYDAGAAPEAEHYAGELRWNGMLVAARRYIPFPSDVLAKFQFYRDHFTLEEFRLKLPRSDFRVTAALASFAEPRWSFNYDGRVSLDDLEKIMRKPNSPDGRVEFSGNGSYAAGAVEVSGRYNARDLRLPYRWFHAEGIHSQGHIRVRNRKLELTEFNAQGLGGVVTGRMDLDFDGLKFRVDSRVRGFRLREVLAAVDHEGFPVAQLHWNGLVDVDSVTTWERDFKSVTSKGISRWAPPLEQREGEIPVSAHLDYDYVMDRSSLQLKDSEITTSTSRVRFHGLLGASNTALEANLTADDLKPWNDFIYALRSPDAERIPITGRATWQGRVLGRLDNPTFTGHAVAREAAYGAMYWDEIEGEITYSPDELRLANMRAKRGGAAAAFDMWLTLDRWRFLPESAWGFEATTERAPTDELQALIGTTVEARGLLTGQFRGRGTRADPEISGLFDVTDPQAYGFRADRVRGRLDFRRDEVRISNAEVRLGGGLVTGNFLYRGANQEIAFDAAGAALPIDNVPQLQGSGIPFSGQLSFQISGSGTLLQPKTEGAMRLVNLTVGKDNLGSFDGKLRSDGRELHLDLNSILLERGAGLKGQVDLTLGGDYPFRGEVNVEQFDLDAFIVAALRTDALTGHSSVTGRITLAGALLKPETIEVQADLSALALDFEYVRLENAGPVRFAYRRDEIRIEQMQLRGAETDINITGFARFTGEKPVNLRLTGAVNLRLLGGFIRDLEARGAAQVNASVEGTLSSPRITGNLRVENAAATYEDFPVGLSQVSGNFVFDRSRMVFENLAAETGGGRMVISGTVTYGDGPFRYDLNGRATRVRVRYPEGMSWLAGGTLRLSGTMRGAVLSGRVVVDRLLLAESVDLGGFFGPPSPTGGRLTASEFLRNLQFDIEATSSPDARLEWASARIDSEASVRVRGTWVLPLITGHVRLLSGEVTFRGNRYRITRGDISFAAARAEGPSINIEAATTIRQYEVTLNLTGRVSQPQLSYRSDPPLPASDVVALLALGHTGEETELRSAGQAQTPEAGATALLGEAISSQLGGRIERLFGISRFKVDPFLAGAGSEQNASARITIEQQVTPDLVITYITNVTSTQQQVIQVEYNVTREISVVALRDQNGTFGLDIKFKKRFR